MSKFCLEKLVVFTILTNACILITLICENVFGENVRHNNEVFTAWQTIVITYKQPISGGHIKALQFLNSRPLRFPWIGLTEKDWFWDEREEECKEKRLFGRRWKRESLVGLSVPKAYLVGIHLCGAILGESDLQGAYLREAKLQGAYLRVENLTHEQIKSACFWDKAIYKGEWNKEREALVAIEPENTNYIEELKNETASDPGEPIDCSFWEKY